MPGQIPPTASMKADQRVSALALETGATEDQIRTIIELVGNVRSSIIREARILKNQTGG